MSTKASVNAMDDVDRLFQCFKCGISPPPSAMRERKRSKKALDKGSITPKTLKNSTAKGLDEGRENVTNRHVGSDNSCTRTIKLSGGKHFSPVVFYGSPNGVPPKRPLSLLKLLREIRIDLSEESDSSFRGVWATFPRQEEAIKFAKGHRNMRVFSYQDHFSGQRRFLVSTFEEFWKRYKSMDPRHRHHYEVIQEGFSCHIYFDLEFNQKENAGRNGDELVDILISVILEALREKYSIEGKEDWIVELDSSTKDKFSRHLIIRIPKVAFKDNSHVGAFVGEICSRIVNAKETDERFEKLFVRKESNDCEKKLFVDTAVYTRNRCFRLPLSSKAGKTSILLPTGRYKCKDMGEEEVFMNSLICNMDSDCEKLLVCRLELDCMKTLCFDTEMNNSNFVRHQAVSHRSQVDSSYFVGKSPFPLLDLFIESIASTGNVSGKIRCWYWFSEHELIIYSMLRNRYCERIGREHKSNHVMYIVDLRRGVYYQKCYDPDCRDYRSPIRPVPDTCIPEGESLMEDEAYLDNATNSSWWLEAVKMADDLENKPNSLQQLSPEEDDEDWWEAAESKVSQTEELILSLPSCLIHPTSSASA